MFSIQFEIESPSGRELELSLASLRIGDFMETFEVSLEYWTQEDYQQQWVDAVTRILSGEISSCLITSITNPATANLLFWWPIYQLQDCVIIQNQVLFLNELGQPFNENRPYDYVQERQTYSEDGAPISEWSTSVEDLQYWIECYK